MSFLHIYIGLKYNHKGLIDMHVERGGVAE